MICVRSRIIRKLTFACLALGLGALGPAACAKKKADKLATPGESSREPMPDLPFADTDRSRPPQASDVRAEDEAPSNEGPVSESSSPDGVGARPTLKIEGEVKDAESAKAALTKLWPDLELSCWLLEGCFQRGDLDGDGQQDALVMVKQVCDTAPCPMGVAIISSRGQHLRLGAGKDPLLPWWEWELQEKSGLIEWHLDSDARAGDDWVGTVSVVVSPSAGKSKCATAMQLRSDVLVINGTDASGALVWFDGDWAMTDCGY